MTSCVCDTLIIINPAYLGCNMQKCDKHVTPIHTLFFTTIQNQETEDDHEGPCQLRREGLYHSWALSRYCRPQTTQCAAVGGQSWRILQWCLPLSEWAVHEPCCCHDSFALQVLPLVEHGQKPTQRGSWASAVGIWMTDKQHEVEDPSGSCILPHNWFDESPHFNCTPNPKKNKLNLMQGTWSAPSVVIVMVWAITSADTSFNAQ